MGDDYQLPPIVLSSEAQTKGMDVSLLKRLVEAHPEAAICLTAQYRMNDHIMSLCNTLIYENRMSCATTAIASARLLLPSFPPPLLSSCHSSFPLSLPPSCPPSCLPSFPPNTESHLNSAQNRLSDWLLHTLNPDNSVVFLNTDTLYDKKSLSPLKNNAGSICREGFVASSSSSSSSLFANLLGSTTKGEHTYDIKNDSKTSGSASEKGPEGKAIGVVQYGVNVHPHEVQVVLQIVKGLRICGLDVHKGKGLGVISPYRSQVRALKSGLSSLFSSDKIDNVSSAESSSYADRDMTGMKRVGVDEKREEKADSKECEVSTVDSFQGRDMDVVILSTVKNVDEGLVRYMLIDINYFCLHRHFFHVLLLLRINRCCVYPFHYLFCILHRVVPCILPFFHSLFHSAILPSVQGAGDLLRDWRRINVAITRYLYARY